MQVGLSKLKLFKAHGYLEVLDNISTMNAEAEEIYASYTDFLREMLRHPYFYGDLLLNRIIPDALSNSELIQPLATILAFSYNQPEYSERDPEEFLRYVQGEIVKLLESDESLR